MVKLGVNIDHVATVRQARKGRVPDLLEAALSAERAGAQGITVHLREDRRHVQDADVLMLKKNIRTKLNLEMAAADSIVAFALKAKPHDACLVPERRQELTTEGGLDAAGNKKKIARAVGRLKQAGIRVSLFIDPAPRQVRAAREIGAQVIELHTGSYAEAKNDLHRRAEFRKLVEAGCLARELGLVLNAGHGLDYENVLPVAKLQGMNELNIGFSIVARSIFTGLERAVREMRSLLKSAE